MGETARISETITFNFATAEQQRRFHAVLAGNEDLTSNYFGRNQPGPWELLTKEQTEELMEAIKRQAIDDCIKVVRAEADRHAKDAEEFEPLGGDVNARISRVKKYTCDHIASRLEALKGQKT